MRGAQKLYIIFAMSCGPKIISEGRKDRKEEEKERRKEERREAGRKEEKEREKESGR